MDFGRESDSLPCEACGQPTREGKPYCPEHVDQQPYVAELLAELARQEAELAMVSLHGSDAVDTSGLTARELLQLVRLHGPRTVQRLGRELNIKPIIIRSYVRAMSEVGMVELGISKRGKTVVRASDGWRVAEGERHAA